MKSVYVFNNWKISILLPIIKTEWCTLTEKGFLIITIFFISIVFVEIMQSVLYTPSTFNVKIVTKLEACWAVV